MTQILLIEPDKLLAKTYKTALESDGYEVAHVTSGQAAVDYADENKPALIILELQLPAHDGVEFLYEFRSYTDWEDIPIIVNTNISTDNLQEGKEVLRGELGVRACHYKPNLTLQLLLRSVEEQLSNK